MSTTLLTPVSLYFLVWRRPETGDCFENEKRQSGYRCVSFSTFSQFTDSILLHRRFTLRRRNITVLRNPLTHYIGRHLRILRSVQFIFAGTVYNNPLTNCATRVCRACADETACVAERYLTLRICGYMEREAHPCGRKNPLPFPYFEAVAALRFSPCYDRKWVIHKRVVLI